MSHDTHYLRRVPGTAGWPAQAILLSTGTCERGIITACSAQVWPGETKDIAGTLGLTDSAERQLGVVMLSQKAILDIETQLGQAECYRDIANATKSR